MQPLKQGFGPAHDLEPTYHHGQMNYVHSPNLQGSGPIVGHGVNGQANNLADFNYA